jgi:pimeloyl-ACP methyl ester carboxylesterase
MSVQRSTVVLVHGGWRGSWCWAEVVPLLHRQGLCVRTIDLPSIDADPDDGSALSGDAAAVTALLDDTQEPALLCGHSYDRMVITHAAAGRDDVARLVYLCAFMPDAGESLLSIIEGRAPWIVEIEDGRWLPDLEQAAATSYADCDAETQRASTARLRPMPTAPIGEPVTSAAWREPQGQTELTRRKPGMLDAATYAADSPTTRSRAGRARRRGASARGCGSSLRSSHRGAPR